MDRRTKIVCTLGPASSDRDTIRNLAVAGMDVVRLNFSHGTHETHRRLIDEVREIARQEGRIVPILQDLQGPKIRIGEIQHGGVLIHQGRRLTLTTNPIEYGTDQLVFVNYQSLADDVDPGGRILIDDGLLELQVIATKEHEVITEVVVGGPLRSRKGVNLPNIRTSTPSLTEKDLADLAFGISMDVDIIALSFVRDASDVENLKQRVHQTGKRISIVAKIEKPEAVRNIDEILAVADGIMVARGDLGIEIPIAQVPGAQKTIIKKCLAAAKPVITATQMLDSMIENPRPTRAEASDVANAMLDGSDALMLSGETAVGKRPVRVVEVMAGVIRQAETFAHTFRLFDKRYEACDEPKRDVTDAVCLTADNLAEQIGAVAIVCLTATGATARAIARHRPTMPIFAFTDDERVVGQLGLLWGTKAFFIPFQHDTDLGVHGAKKVLVDHGYVKTGDLIVFTAGMPLPEKGRTNMVHVRRIT